MTQIYMPRQLKEGPNQGRWHYTCSNASGRHVYPVGACATDCPGHDTADGATRHYVEGVCAGEIRTRVEEDAKRACEVCGNWTHNRALLWGQPFLSEVSVCASHDPRPALRAAVFQHYRFEDK